jgi:L-cysteine desulfidase
MSGMRVPIIAIAGSGNHGIVNFLGPLAVAQAVGASEEQLARALAISSTVTVYIKGFIQRMTAFCGCAVAASPGVAASATHLLGGNWDAMTRAMHSVIGALAGMVCDGAKESCAYKISMATATAIQSAYLAAEGVGVESQMGVVGADIEATIRNLGALNNPGMVETDRFLLDLIAGSR